jgi:hypothetical protein
MNTDTGRETMGADHLESGEANVGHAQIAVWKERVKIAIVMIGIIVQMKHPLTIIAGKVEKSGCKQAGLYPHCVYSFLSRMRSTSGLLECGSWLR